jgi:hypothetical protein
MSTEVEKFIRSLRELAIPEDEFMLEGLLYQLTEPLEAVGDIDPAIPHIFRFFERYPDAEHGSPGALVHFLERFPKRYESELIASLKRAPAPHPVWMVNRILNSNLSEKQRNEWMEVLRSVETNPNSSEMAVIQAESFLKHQTETG